MAERISRVTGHAIKYVDLPDSAIHDALGGAGMPEWQVTALLELQQYYRSGKCAEVTDVLPKIRGRPSITVEQFLTESKASFEPQTAKSYSRSTIR